MSRAVDDGWSLLDDPAQAVSVCGVLTLLVVSILVAWWLGRRFGRLARSEQAQARAQRAVRGEARAREVLEAAGYSVVAEQERAIWWIEVDGREMEVELRADFVVTDRQGRKLVAEVKTGALAPDIGHAATRRQLLEYTLAYRLDGVLLVDVEAGTVLRVRFPGVS